MRRNAFNLMSMDNNLFPDFNQAMRTDIIDASDEYHLNIELPGYSKDDINVSYEDGYLTVSATKNKVEENKVHSEISYSSSVSRSFYIGNVLEENIKAKYVDGILQVSVPKAIDNKDNLITIE